MPFSKSQDPGSSSVLPTIFKQLGEDEGLEEPKVVCEEALWVLFRGTAVDVVGNVVVGVVVVVVLTSQ